MLLYKGITVLGITLPVVGGSKNGQTNGLEQVALGAVKRPILFSALY